MKVKIEHLIIAIILIGIYLLINRCGCNDTFVIGANQNNASLCNWYNTFPRDSTSTSAKELCNDSKYCTWGKRNWYSGFTKSCIPLELNDRGEPIKDYMRVWCRRHIGADEKKLCKDDPHCKWDHQFGGMSAKRCMPISLDIIPHKILSDEARQEMDSLIREGGDLYNYFVTLEEEFIQGDGKDMKG